MQISNNHLVSVVLTNVRSEDGDIITNTQSSFVTTMTPMYSSPQRVREVAGSYISEISDDVLNQLILKYSREADILATCDTTTSEKWSHWSTQWVSMRVAIDSIYNSTLYLGESGGKTYKKLGDFSISRDSGGGDGAGPANAFLKKLECEVFKLDVSIRLCREPLLECESENVDSSSLYNPSAAQTVVKGKDSGDRPVFGRTFYQSGRHPQWTGWLVRNNRKYMTNYNGNMYWEDKYYEDRRK